MSGMLRGAVSKALWVGRATSAVVGLAIVLALVVGLASAAFGANGQAWILGQGNVATAITSLGGAVGVDGPMLRITNNNGGTDDTALDLRVQEGEAPMRVNRDSKVANLNADQIDGLNSTDFVQGSGVAISSARAVIKGDFVYLYDTFQKDRLGLNVAYKCPNTLTDSGLLRFTNYTSDTVNLFSDNGSADPVYTTVAPGGSGASSDYDQATNPSGERITFQVQGTRVGTVEVFSVHRANDCHAQVQALVTP